MKSVQRYELFGGIALKNHALFYFFIGIVSQNETRNRQTNYEKSHAIICMINILTKYIIPYKHKYTNKQTDVLLSF